MMQSDSATAGGYLGGGKCPWLRLRSFCFSWSLLKWRFQCRWHTEFLWTALHSNTANQPQRLLEDSQTSLWLLPTVQAISLQAGQLCFAEWPQGQAIGSHPSTSLMGNRNQLGFCLGPQKPWRTEMAMSSLSSRYSPCHGPLSPTGLGTEEPLTIKNI